MKLSIISDERVSDNKSGPLWCVDLIQSVDNLKELGEVMLNFHVCPGVFKDNLRNKEHFQSIDYLCFDFDSGMSSSNVEMKCKLMGWNHLIIGSKNHLKDKEDGKGCIERFHVFLPLKKPITETDFYKYCVEKVSEQMSWNSDLAAKDSTRYFYEHSTVLYCNELRNNMDTKWLSDKRTEEKRTMEKMNGIKKRLFELKHPTTIPPLQVFYRTEAYQSMIDGKLQSGEGRYNLSNHILGVMVKCGLDPVTIEELFIKYGGSLDGNGMNLKSIQERVNSWS
jgi:hypothetical protein